MGPRRVQALNGYRPLTHFHAAAVHRPFVLHSLDALQDALDTMHRPLLTKVQKPDLAQSFDALQSAFEETVQLPCLAVQ